MKKSYKRNIAALLVISNAVSGLSSITVFGESEKTLPPSGNYAVSYLSQEDFLNPEYVTYEEKLKTASPEEAKRLKAVPPSKYIYGEKYGGESNSSKVTNRSSSSLPSSYNTALMNSSALGKNQYNTELGWVFASNAVFERTLLKKFGVNNKEFSAQHLRYGTADNLENPYQWYRSCRDGGLFDYAAGYWRRNDVSGPVIQSNMPFDPATNLTINESVLDTYSPENYYTKNTVTLSWIGANPSTLQVSQRIIDIKNMINDNGAVYAGMYLDASGFSTNMKNYFCLNVGDNYKEHGVAIVGWDDNYSASNFKNSPTQNGAFIVQSSQIPGYTTRRFFYISYDMVKGLHDVSAITDLTYKDFYDNIYEYSKVRPEWSDDASSTVTTNAYSMKLTLDTDYDEKITAVSTYNLVPNSRFDVYVSTTGEYADLQKVNVTNVIDNGLHVADGLPAESTVSHNGSVSNIGYVTFNLDNPVEVDEDSDIIVAFEVYNSIANAQTIPKHDNTRTLTNGVNKCAIASSMDNMKSGNRTMMGNNSAEIKVYTKNMPSIIDSNGEITWDMGGEYFDAYRPTSNGDGSLVYRNVNEGGLKITATDDKPIRFDKCCTHVNNLNYRGCLVLMGQGGRDERSLIFDVNGPSYIYLTGKSGSEYPKTVYLESMYGDNYSSSATISTHNTIKFDYNSQSADTLCLYMKPGNLHIYSISIVPKDTSIAETVETWDFSDSAYQSMGHILENTVINGITFTKGINPLNLSDIEDGFKYNGSIDFNGAGGRDYNSLSFIAKANSDIYITARNGDNDNETLYMKVANAYGDTNSGLDIINGNSDDTISIIKTARTYRIRNTGPTQRILLFSLYDAMRVYKISVVPIDDTYFTINKEWNFSNSAFSNYGNITGTVEYPEYPYNNEPKIRFEGTYSNPVRFVNKSTTYNGVTYSRAIKFANCRMDNTERCRISFEVPDSETTPTKIAIIANGNNSQTGKLLVVNAYGEIIGRFDTNTTTNKYIATYTGGADRLYILAPTGSSSNEINIFDVAVSNTNSSYVNNYSNELPTGSDNTEELVDTSAIEESVSNPEVTDPETISESEQVQPDEVVENKEEASEISSNNSDMNDIIESEISEDAVIEEDADSASNDSDIVDLNETVDDMELSAN